MTMQLNYVVPGNLGTNVGAGTDGVLIGAITPTDPTMVLLKSAAVAPLCMAEDGNLYTNYDTEIQESTADDVPALPAVPAVNDAFYIGNATYTFSRVDLQITTQGVGTWTIVWEYWNGTAWTALADVTDGTTGFTAAAGWVSVTFTLPTAWAKNTVDDVNAYWIRGRVSVYSAVTTQPLLGQGWIVVASSDASWTDDTTDFTDAGAGDCDLLPAFPVVGDGIYIGYTEKFCKLKVTTSQARTGTATLTLKYWNGTAWANVSIVDDDSVGWSTAAGTLLVNFVPPSDWTANTAANGPNGEAGFFVCMELTAMTSVTQQPLATQGWVLPMKTNATGPPAPTSGTIVTGSYNALTASGSTEDSVFLLINSTTGAFDVLTWTKATAYVTEVISLAVQEGETITMVQVEEDGTTEFANANIVLII